jgi:1-acyl-sn-glycerol-3-phosphate acyltransferase
MPFLKNLMAWNSADSADYKVLRDGLHGISPVVNKNGGRKPKHLYILPGGIQEIYLSRPGTFEICELNVGLIKLAMETGAWLLPCFVFGGTDFFHNLITGDGFLPNLFRKWRMGITIYWGKFPYIIPIPFTPKVTLVISDPIVIDKYTGDISKIPMDKIRSIRKQYQDAMLSLFETYKAAAGYPNAKLSFIAKEKSSK